MVINNNSKRLDFGLLSKSDNFHSLNTDSKKKWMLLNASLTFESKSSFLSISDDNRVFPNVFFNPGLLKR